MTNELRTVSSAAVVTRSVYDPHLLFTAEVDTVVAERNVIANHRTAGIQTAEVESLSMNGHEIQRLTDVLKWIRRQLTLDSRC